MVLLQITVYLYKLMFLSSDVLVLNTISEEEDPTEYESLRKPSLEISQIAGPSDKEETLSEIETQDEPTENLINQLSNKLPDKDTKPNENFIQPPNYDVSFDHSWYQSEFHDEPAATKKSDFKDGMPEVASREIAARLSEKIVSDLVFSAVESGPDDNDKLFIFIEETLTCMIDDAVKSERPPTLCNTDIYQWMAYFYMQFCGYLFFLNTLAGMQDTSMTVAKEMATMIADLVDEVAENHDYLHFDDEMPERVAKSMLWKIINSRPLQRRYLGLRDSLVTAGDILDEIINCVSSHLFDRSSSVYDEIISGEVTIEEQKSLYNVPKECKEFMGVFNIAEHVVKTTIDNAKETAALLSKRRVTESRSTASKRKSTMSIRHYQFPSIEIFDVHTGIEAIKGLINTWNYNEAWMYAIDFLTAQSDECSDYFFYEVKWSLPTRLYPIAQATASIIFRIEVSRVKPPVCSVDVNYYFEGNCVVHIPFKGPFKEEWLFSILESKLELFKRLNF